jgi:PAS domain S-box-containing protein
MACSDDDILLLDFLVEDLANSTELERIVLLRLDSSSHVFESQVYYGFQESSVGHFQIPFSQINGLLKKAYDDHEPLSVINYSECEQTPSPSSAQLRRLRKKDSGDHIPSNRRPRIHLCIPKKDTGEGCTGTYSRFEQYSLDPLEGQDSTISHLLGEIDSFLILPICDDKKCFGYILADKSLSGNEITYDEIRLASALVKHAAYAVGRARKQHEMLGKIADQLNEIGELKSFYQSIIQNLRNGLITVDQFLKINSVNRAAEVILGYTGVELLGKSLDYFFASADEHRKCYFLDTADEIDSCMGQVLEIPMRRKNGEVFPAEACYSVITDTRDEISGLSCIFQDITTRKAMEQDLARVDRLASLGELAAGVAHEIKNPLAGIAGAMQIVIQNRDKEKSFSFIFHEVLEQVNRLDSFVNNLLQFARPGQTQFTNVNVGEILKKVLFFITVQLEEKKIVVHNEIVEKPTFVLGDAGQLQQVFLNILINAIDAMGKGGVITIQSHDQNFSHPLTNPRNKCANPFGYLKSGEINITITDTGKGIESDSLETIFNPFYTTKSTGTGLGLSISHRIIEQHEGTITVKSKPGRGTTFNVQLPVCSVRG